MNSRCPVCSMLPVGGRCPVHGLDVVVIKETTPPPPRAAVAPTVPWVEVEGPVTTLPRTQAEAELQEQRARTATKHEAEVEELRARAAFWKSAEEAASAWTALLVPANVKALQAQYDELQGHVSELMVDLRQRNREVEERDAELGRLREEVERLRAQSAQEQQ